MDNESELRKELEILSSEIIRRDEEKQEKPSLWRRIFGRLIYDGPKTCGHCKYWRLHTKWDKYNGWYRPNKGDCKLIFSRDNEEKHESEEGCDRFAAKRKYKHRVRP